MHIVHRPLLVQESLSLDSLVARFPYATVKTKYIPIYDEQQNIKNEKVRFYIGLRMEMEVTLKNVLERNKVIDGKDFSQFSILATILENSRINGTDIWLIPRDTISGNTIITSEEVAYSSGGNKYCLASDINIKQYNKLFLESGQEVNLKFITKNIVQLPTITTGYGYLGYGDLGYGHTE